MKRIATGLPSFEEIISAKDIVYVDKTEYIHKMLSSADKFFFISRPRRFGKSLMCSTLDALFSGKKELFEGLAISRTDYDFKKYPVLHFDFSTLKFSTYEAFLERLQAHVLYHAEEFCVSIERKAPAAMLDDLLRVLKDPVIIIDEFDSPLIEAVSRDNKELAGLMRDEFNSFYSIIKANTSRIRFFFMTGCTKLSGMSIFSAMNNLNDISSDEENAGMFGYTEAELEENFGDYIDDKLGRTADTYSSRTEFLDSLRAYYDGYRFSPDVDVKVYNPVSVGTYFSKKQTEFKNYWMNTGGMSTLAVTLARKADLIDIVDSEIKVNIQKVSTFDIMQIAESRISDVAIYVLLYYAGYLTIADYNGSQMLTFDFPNTEVRSTFLSSLVETYSEDGEDPAAMVDEVRVAAGNGQIRTMITGLNDYYRIFNYKDLPSKFRERAVHILFKAFFSMLGYPVFTEVPSGEGVSDAVLMAPKVNYIIEFKADGRTSEGAMKQLLDKHYAELLTVEKKPLHLIGIDFRTESKQIVSYTHQLYGTEEVETIQIAK